jgi:hypothetical protein
MEASLLSYSVDVVALGKAVAVVATMLGRVTERLTPRS